MASASASWTPEAWFSPDARSSHSDIGDSHARLPYVQRAPLDGMSLAVQGTKSVRRGRLGGDELGISSPRCGVGKFGYPNAWSGARMDRRDSGIGSRA